MKNLTSAMHALGLALLQKVPLWKLDLSLIRPTLLRRIRM